MGATRGDERNIVGIMEQEKQAIMREARAHPESVNMPEIADSPYKSFTFYGKFFHPRQLAYQEHDTGTRSGPELPLHLH